MDGGEFNTNYDANSIHLTGNNLTSILGIKVQFQPEFLKGEEKSNIIIAITKIYKIPHLIAITMLIQNIMKKILGHPLQ